MSKSRPKPGASVKRGYSGRNSQESDDDITQLLAKLAIAQKYPSGEPATFGLTHDWAHSSVRVMTGARGRGLFMDRDIPAGTLLLVSHSTGLTPLAANPNVALGMDVLASHLFDAKVISELSLKTSNKLSSAKDYNVKAGNGMYASAPKLAECFPIGYLDLFPSSSQAIEMKLPNPLLEEYSGANSSGITSTNGKSSVKLTLPTWLRQTELDTLLKDLKNPNFQEKLKHAIHVARFNSILVSEDTVSSLSMALTQGAFAAPIVTSQTKLEHLPCFALFPTMALVNHSCDPNVSPRMHYVSNSAVPASYTRQISQRPRLVVTVTSLVDMKAGDELVFNYTPLIGTDGSRSVPWLPAIRRINLQAQHQFICKCMRCQFQPELHPLTKGTGPIALLASDVEDSKKGKAEELFKALTSRFEEPVSHEAKIQLFETLLQGIKEEATSLALLKQGSGEANEQPKNQLAVQMPTPEELSNRPDTPLSVFSSDPYVLIAVNPAMSIDLTLLNMDVAQTEAWKSEREAVFSATRTLASDGAALSPLVEVIEKGLRLLFQLFNLKNNFVASNVSMATPSQIRQIIISLVMKSSTQEQESSASSKNSTKRFKILLPLLREHQKSEQDLTSGQISLNPYDDTASLHVEHSKLCFAAVTQKVAEHNRSSQETKDDSKQTSVSANDSHLHISSAPIQMCPAIELCLTGYDKARTLLMALPGISEREEAAGVSTQDMASETQATSQLTISLLESVAKILDGSVGSLHWSRFLVHSGLGAAYTYSGRHLEALISRIACYVIASLCVPDNHFSLIPLLDVVLDSLLEVLRCL